MQVDVGECISCKKQFSFESSRCSQIILKQGSPDSMIIFLTQCPFCQAENQVKMPWEEYGVIDY